MTTTELIELLKKYERGGATGRPREVMFEVDDRIIDTDGIEVTGSGDGLISELYLSLPSAQPEQPEIIRCKDCKQFRRWIDTNTCFCDITESEISDNDFCSRAERRTDG